MGGRIRHAADTDFGAHFFLYFIIFTPFAGGALIFNTNFFSPHLLYCSQIATALERYFNHKLRERNRNRTQSIAELRQHISGQACSSPPVIKKGFEPETRHMSPRLFHRVGANVVGNGYQVILLGNLFRRGTISALEEEILLLVFINVNKFLNQITADFSEIRDVFGEIHLQMYFEVTL